MKKLVKTILSAITIIMIVIIPMQVSANVLDDDTGSITLTLGQGQDLTSVENVEISCSKVADLVNGEYILLDEFKQTNIDLNEIKTADQLQESAEKLQDLVNNDYIQYTDEKGIVSFEDLSVGVYLIKALDTTNYDELTPTLIAVPTFNELLGQMLYHIQIEPKHAPKTGNILIKKANEELELLSGAEFTLYEDVNKNKVLDDEDKKVGIFNETEKGIYEFTDLKYAYYLIKETKAPSGYVVDENIYPVIIYGENKDNVVIQNNDNGYFINAYKIGTAKFFDSITPYIENSGFLALTSDEMSITFYFALLIITGISILIIAKMKKKNKTE